MAVGCGAKCAKIILVAFNIIFILTGCCLIAAGIVLIADKNITAVIDQITSIISDNDSNLFRYAAVLLISMGAFILVVSALGFFGAVCENYPALGVYIALLVVIFGGEVAGGIIAMVFKAKIENKIDGYLENYIISTPYYKRTTNPNNSTNCSATPVGASMDYIQIVFDCCGVAQNDMTYESTNYTVASVCPELGLAGNKPLTCYMEIPDDENTILGIRNSANQSAMLPYFSKTTQKTEGCADSFILWIDTYAPALIGIGIGFAVFQLFGIIFAVCLCQNLGEYEDF